MVAGLLDDLRTRAFGALEDLMEVGLLEDLRVRAFGAFEDLTEVGLLDDLRERPSAPMMRSRMATRKVVMNFIFEKRRLFQGR